MPKEKRYIYRERWRGGLKETIKLMLIRPPPFHLSFYVAMSFPASGLETTYRNNLREVAKLLQKNHQDKYMV